ncbi:putative protease YrrO [Erysipelotrichaceae bacterium]|nr:putative protease YrrO [Erysipelotrichaceae bacterium]
MRKKIAEIRDGKRVIIKKPELLAPAGNLEKLKVAILYGADAVFIGGKKFGLRSSADNFSIEEMAEGVQFAKAHNAKIYVTTNIFAHDEDLADLDAYLIALEGAGIYGIIVADPYIIHRCQIVAPLVEVHLSTQQSLLNWQTASFYEKEGLHRVVLAREMMKEEIQEVIDKTAIELEVFIHGAMCIAFSGRCTLSNHMTSRDSNRGGCCQSCRWEYDLVAESGAEVVKTIAADLDQFSMSPKDLSLLQSIPEMIEMGIDSFKIEGRMKSIHYVATTVSVYRKLIDLYCENPDDFVLDAALIAELQKCANRATAESFFHGMPDEKQQLFNSRMEHPTKEFIGITQGFQKEKNLLKLEQRNFFKKGDTIEFFGPKMENISWKVTAIFNAAMEEVDAARHPQEIVYIPFDRELPEYTLMRKLESN